MITNPPKLPLPEVALVDPKTGHMTRGWYDYFRQVDDRLRKLIGFGGAGSVTVATLPSAATAGAGVRAFVTDASATTFHSTVAGGGANKVPVVSDGTNWLIG